jgi:hypothetical protein
MLADMPVVPLLHIFRAANMLLYARSRKVRMVEILCGDQSMDCRAQT